VTLEEEIEAKLKSHDVVFRYMQDSDINFILNSWLSSYRNSLPVTHVPNDVYFPEQKKIIHSLLDNVSVLIIADSEDTSVDIGYIIGERKDNFFIIDWVYVKHLFKNFGLAQTLIHFLAGKDVEKIVFTHQPKETNRYFVDCLSKYYKLEFNPYLQQRHLKEYHEANPYTDIPISSPRWRLKNKF